MKKRKDHTAPSIRGAVDNYISESYGIEGSQKWERFPDFRVYAHADGRSGKWFCLMMTVARERLGLEGEGDVDVMNVKVDPFSRDSFLMTPGILPAYHMNKAHWISVLLDGTVEQSLAEMLIDISYELTGPKNQAEKKARRTEWLVPANPKYFDIEANINQEGDGTFIWKQSTDVHVGDTVYIYVAAPVSAIRYRCRALEVGIPFDHEDENVKITHVMKLELLQRFDDEPVGLDILRDHGVYAVRGPRGIPHSLVEEIRNMYPY